ncbi:MAG: hypothetical protein WCT99_11635 [Bacteroidota bacterium]|jgi:hypothetical protein
MIKKIIVPLFLVVSIGLAGVFKAGSIHPTSDGNNITVTWETVDETNVKEFIVERASSDSYEFSPIGTVTDLLGPNRTYKFIDQSAFKTTTSVFRYRITCVFKNGSRETSEVSDRTYHKVSSVKRTWGSLKAMFR